MSDTKVNKIEKTVAIDKKKAHASPAQVNTIVERNKALDGMDYVETVERKLVPNAKGKANGLAEVVGQVVQPKASFESIKAHLLDNNANVKDGDDAERLICETFIDANTNDAYLRTVWNTKEGKELVVPVGAPFQKTESKESTAEKDKKIEALMKEIEEMKAKLSA